jgi:cytochrome c oxidase subunit I
MSLLTPCTFVGILGMPRSIYTYEADRGWNTLNMIISMGGMFQAVAVLIFAWNLVDSYLHGKEAGNDPWDAWTLEWSTPSPPPAYNFATDPEVRSRGRSGISSTPTIPTGSTNNEHDSHLRG